jgi:hypothetical protein
MSIASMSELKVFDVRVLSRQSAPSSETEAVDKKFWSALGAQKTENASANTKRCCPKKIKNLSDLMS